MTEINATIPDEFSTVALAMVITDKPEEKWVVSLTKGQYKKGNKYECQHGKGITPQDAINNAIEMFNNDNSKRYWAS